MPGQQSSRVTYKRLVDPVQIGVVRGFTSMSEHNKAVANSSNIKAALEAKHIPYAANDRGRTGSMFYYVSARDFEKVKKLGLEDFFSH